MTLHIVVSSPFQASALEDCLEVIQEGDSLLLIADGVYGITSTRLQGSPCCVYFVQDDARQRGIDGPSDCHPLDYPGVVALTESHAAIQTWR